MKRGKIKRKKEVGGGGNWVDKAISKNKERSEKVLEEYMEWMKPGTWISTPGVERCSIKPAKYHLQEEDFPFYMDRSGPSLYYYIYTKGGNKLIYGGTEKSIPDPTVRKKFTEWLKSN